MSRDRDTVTAVTAVTTVQAGKGPAMGSVLVDKYRVEGTLGFGGMGLVIRAHNMAIDERVAIKLLREDVQLDAEHAERFLREAKAAVRLKSEHVAKIRDVGTLEDGRPYMVMELLEGLDLGKLLLDHGSIDATRAVDLVLQACDALAEAHALGIVHRDIKPTNLFLTKRRDDTDLLKVLDFGISKAYGGPEMSLTQTSSMLGTPAYMSPEQMRSARTVDPRSDIWALGTVLYELVEGRLPFEASNFAELCVLVSTEPPAPMVKARHLEPIMYRCLAKPLHERYQSIGELAQDLEPYASEPGRASRQVARILRVLGSPASRDSTPLPMTRESVKHLSPATRESIDRAHGAFAATPTSTAIAPLKSSGGVWKSVLVLLLLFGIGIGAGLYVTGSGALAERAADPAPDANEAIGTTAPADAAVVDVDVDATPQSEPAGVIIVDAGVPADASPVEKTVKPPPRKPPRKQPPRKQPPRTDETKSTAGGSANTPPPPPPPPKKKCDPFANPKGCQ